MIHLWLTNTAMASKDCDRSLASESRVTFHVRAEYASTVRQFKAVRASNVTGPRDLQRCWTRAGLPLMQWGVSSRPANSASRIPQDAQ